VRVFLILLFLIGCSEPPTTKQVSLYSDGTLIRTWETKNIYAKFDSFVVFEDENGDRVTISGTCIIEKKTIKEK
jgi:hypothetical protein